jgi:hypothetical protein
MPIRRPTSVIPAGLILLAVAAHSATAQTVFPTGTTIYNPAEAHSSYILISDHTAVGNHASASVRAAAGGSPSDIRLIDMNGNVVHTWEVAPYFNKRSRLPPQREPRLRRPQPDDLQIRLGWERGLDPRGHRLGQRHARLAQQQPAADRSRTDP